ncbi:MAG TPA: hypothetical protein VHV76_12025 [Mycobacteriales bacterium]|jgi:hypothetical protein|nr:hypothetical protein [Mycobacteriales bacterium]
MAKALMGHVGSGLDVRLASELKRLRDRVRDLENEVIRLRVENAELSSVAHVDEEMVRLTVAENAREHEPALT